MKSMCLGILRFWGSMPISELNLKSGELYIQPGDFCPVFSRSIALVLGSLFS